MANKFTGRLLSGGAVMFWCWSEMHPRNLYLKLRDEDYANGFEGERGGWYMTSAGLLDMAHECARLAKLVRAKEKGESE